MNKIVWKEEREEGRGDRNEIWWMLGHWCMVGDQIDLCPEFGGAIENG